ncbi:hypothetical protein [Clostridioides difficile]|nr:hypothetical protein [Clostridioides difficile]HBH3114246.1 hypothetical protein [Clostridioides difficile]
MIVYKKRGGVIHGKIYQTGQQKNPKASGTTKRYFCFRGSRGTGNCY